MSKLGIRVIKKPVTIFILGQLFLILCFTVSLYSIFLWFSVYCVVLQKRSLKNLKANCVSPSHVHLIIGEFDSAQCFYFSKKIAIFGNRNSVYEFGVKLGISDRFWWTNFWFKWAWSSTFQVNISLWLWGNFGANHARICWLHFFPILELCAS